MNHPEDTIAAISTPLGQGGISIVRMSGTAATAIASRLFRSKSGTSLSELPTFSLVYGHVIDKDGGIVDEAVISIMRGPRSYTREDVVEINCHGGMVGVRRVLELLLAEGARLAEPGEFTKRAFLNGRISLEQAEAVADLITARTEEGMRIALQQLSGSLSERLSSIRTALVEDAAQVEAYIDFPEEDIAPRTRGEIVRRLVASASELDRLGRTFDEARFFRDGLAVAIVGRPNVGKSSLLNALLARDRAIVTELPGTTRDIIEEQITIDGLPLVIIDTAGIRHSEETVEREGIRRSLQAMERADFVIAVVDGSTPLIAEDHEVLGRVRGKKAVIAINKSDLPQQLSSVEASESGIPTVAVSAKTGSGLDNLKHMVFSANLGNWQEEREGVVITNLRHKSAVARAAAALGRAGEALTQGSPLEVCSIELREALDSIGEITGAVTTDEILSTIFNTFCIGK